MTIRADAARLGLGAEMSSLRQARPDGAHAIRQVDLGEEIVTSATDGGMEINRNK
ncbi:MAG: hypothetical protein AAGA66_10885 [Bacteroidota bacterium]